MNRVITLLFFGLALLPVSAWAGGFILPSTGGKSAGMAGAWVAQGDDLAVMDHNPAQLVRQQRYGLQLHYTGYHFGAFYEPEAVSGLGEMPATRNADDFLNHIPNLYAGFPVSERLVLGAGIFSPVGPRHTYDPSGPQRYQLQEALIALVWGTVSAAYRIHDTVAASLSLDVGYVMADQQMAFGLLPGYRSLDGTLYVEGSGIQRPRPKLGLLIEPVENLSVGLVGLPGLDINIRGTVRADVPQVGFMPEEAYDNIVASQHAPAELRFGVGYTPAPFRTEATVRYYRWSGYTEQRIELENNQIGAFAIDDLTMPKFYQDTVAVQLGLGYGFLDNHEVRTGYAYDQQAAQDEGLTINEFDSPKHIFALGYGLQFRERYRFDAAYNYVLYEPRTVTDTATGPMSMLGDAPAIGNGTYWWNVQTFSLALGIGF